MSLELSLYHLAEGGDLLELFEMRAEAEAACSEIGIQGEALDDAMHGLAVINEQIAAYMAALPTKVDKVRAVWKRIEVLIQEAADEVKFQSKRGQHLKADLERLKDYCQRCMELIEWKPGKPRKLEGHSGAIYLKGNGSRPAVEVYDETLVPDELCTVTVTMPKDLWLEVCADMSRPVLRRCADGEAKETPCVPSLSLISARLSERCEHCDGAPAVGTKDECQFCGGSGKASVPGARLKPVGQHIECK